MGDYLFDRMVGSVSTKGYFAGLLLNTWVKSCHTSRIDGVRREKIPCAEGFLHLHV